MNNIHDKDESTFEKWICPHCSENGGATIIDDAVLKNHFREILCACMKCSEMYIRKYIHVETIRLVRTDNLNN